MSPVLRIRHELTPNLLRQVLCVIFTGMLTALVAIFVDKGIARTHSHINSLSTPVPESVVLSIALSAAAIIVADAFGPHSAGGGIAHQSAVLTGGWINNFPSLRCLIGKSFGLLLSYASGLSIGKEGPLCAIATCIAHVVWQACFDTKSSSALSPVGHQAATPMVVLASGSAAGVAATFGSPFGGVLFAAEVARSSFASYSLGLSVLCAAASILVAQISSAGELIGLFNVEDVISVSQWSADHVPFFVLIGAAVAVVASGFVHMVALWSRRVVAPLKLQAGPRAFGLTALVAALIQCARHFLPGLGASSSALLQDLMAPGDPQLIRGGSAGLAVFAFLRFLLTVPCVCLPLPSGVFTPVFTAGAALGRSLGNILASAGWILSPQLCSLLGAAAAAAAATHTVSPVLIVLELTGDITSMIPLLVVVLASRGLAQLLSPSIYSIRAVTSRIQPPAAHTLSPHTAAKVPLVLHHSYSPPSAVRTQAPLASEFAVPLTALPHVLVPCPYSAAASLPEQLKNSPYPVPLVDAASGALLGAASPAEVVRAVEKLLAATASDASARRGYLFSFGRFVARILTPADPEPHTDARLPMLGGLVPSAPDPTRSVSLLAPAAKLVYTASPAAVAEWAPAAAAHALLADELSPCVPGCPRAVFVLRRAGHSARLLGAMVAADRPKDFSSVGSDMCSAEATV
jgi:H+/Cl- antiporter ClcA